MHVICYLAVPFLDIYPREILTYIHRKTCTRIFTSMFVIVKTRKWNLNVNRKMGI